jgi:predicted CDP-diglyceride synthetase/phosphatidate cytidylyltransferase
MNSNPIIGGLLGMVLTFVTNVIHQVTMTGVAQAILLGLIAGATGYLGQMLISFMVREILIVCKIKKRKRTRKPRTPHE